MKVSDAMHAGVTWVAPSTSLNAIARKMRDEDVGAIPVGDNDRLVGMVTDRDIVCRGLTNSKALAKLTANDVMSKGITFCRTDDEIDQAIDTMKKNKIRRLPVLDGNKRMVGMLSLGDIARATNKSQCGEVMQAVAAHHS